MPHPARLGSIILFGTLLLCLFGGRVVAQDLPDGFVAEPIGSGWVSPVGLCFLDEQRLLVAERNGRVWYAVGDQKKNLVYDIAAEALINGDRGMLGIAVAPDFDDHGGWLYLLFVVDIDNGRDRANLAFSRLIRVRIEYVGGDVDGDLVALPETRETLLGDTWSTGITSCHLSHTIGSLRFFSDGSLVLTSGDNAHYDFADAGHEDPNCFADGRTPRDQDLGAFRSQYDNTLCGKVLRLDPATGLGLADNPFYTGNPGDLLSRVYARGLRNPFRFTLLAGSGPREALFISDVGWNSWEEIELCLGGENFAWPCFEGLSPQPAYQALDSHGFCDGIGAGHARPLLTWHHVFNSAGFTGNCASGLCVYRGQRYPEVYRGRLFFSDFGGRWLRAAQLDSAMQVESVLTFGTEMGGSVDLVEQPGTLDLVYAAFPGTVARLRYLGAGLRPVAVASATPAHGPGDLLVTLSAQGSSDPEGQDLEYAWDLGLGGASAHGPSVQQAYVGTQAYLARLTVTDTEGLSDSAEVRITPNNTPPAILALDTPLDGSLFVADEPLSLAASALDAEDGSGLQATWTLDLVHDHHVHPDWNTATGLRAEVTPEAHGPGDNHFFVRLRVTDARGLTDEREVEIYDAHSKPKAHLVELAQSRVRVGQRLAPVGHVDFSRGRVSAKQATLTWDWGDGAVDVFHEAAHHADTRPTHTYQRPGTYKLRLIAELEGEHGGELGAEHDGAHAAEQDVVLATIEVVPARPAVAIFAPIEAQRWVPPEEQQEIVAALQTSLASRTSEVRAFELGAGAELAAWMESLASDNLADVLVLLDFVPAPLIEGGMQGSLLERWIAGGNGLVWSGATPFQDVLADDGSAAQTFLGADEFLASTAPFTVLGTGTQIPTPLGESVLPSLPSYPSMRALQYDQIGPHWHLARLFSDALHHQSDALELEHDSHGFYAQFLCANLADLPRAAVLGEYLRDKLGKARFAVPGSTLHAR